MNIPYRRDPVGGYLTSEAEVHNAILLRLELIIVLLSSIAVLLMLIVMKYNDIHSVHYKGLSQRGNVASANCVHKTSIFAP